MRQARGISGLAGNVANAGVPPPPKGKVARSNRAGRAIYKAFKRKYLLT